VVIEAVLMRDGALNFGHVPERPAAHCGLKLIRHL